MSIQCIYRITNSFASTLTTTNISYYDYKGKHIESGAKIYMYGRQSLENMCHSSSES